MNAPTTQKILFLDRDLPLTRPHSRIFSIFSSRNGIFSPLERTRRQAPGAQFFLFHPNAVYENHMASSEGLTSYRAAGHDPQLAHAYLAGQTAGLTACFDQIVDSSSCDPVAILRDLGARFDADAALAIAEKNLRPLETLPAGTWCLGAPRHIYGAPDVEIQPGTLFDTRQGPILLDAGARIGRLSSLQGPLYIGAHSQIDNAQLHGGLVVGQHCRLGGEVEASVINDYSNKHHAGFIGHSLLGRWVNIGALATTSDLKNNYGEVRLSAPADFAPVGSPPPPLLTLNSGQIKLGSIIGDCVKVAIGLRLNAGTVLDSGSNLFGEPVPKYLPPFTWGNGNQRYDATRFIRDCTAIFARRQQPPPPGLAALLTLYEQNRSEPVE
tara:strand:+ start:13176 stop:14321 length:1146 start_codon:yes stop_codon:yes gene_type:complete